MRTDGIWIKDDSGRSLILRGANLGGSTKVPVTPDGATYHKEGFYDHRNVSFVGRPFPLAEADEHFKRLRAWGLTFLRFLTTWEAVEHAGPGLYDEAYLDYLYTVVKKAGEYGIDVFIDPHQDVWSRWTGGDGAPGWTLEAVGMDLTKLDVTGAAVTHQIYGDPFPRMIWPTNLYKLGAGTMFTLFFGGDDFAPATKIEGIPAQEYLQSHYINAIKQIALRLRDLPNVVGYDSLNEPGGGFIGFQDIHTPSTFVATGAIPSPFQAMLLGSGYPQEVDVYQMTSGIVEVTGKQTLNPDGVSLWKPGYECVWKQNGVWTDDGGSPRAPRPDYFAHKPDGSAIRTNDDYLKPFMTRFAREIRTVHPDALIFVEGRIGGHGDHLHWGEDDPQQVVHAPHWYDGLTLFMKQFNPDFSVDIDTQEFVQGQEAVAELFARKLRAHKHASLEAMGGVPTVIGEFGIPFDLENKLAYRNGDFSSHVQALDMYYDAMDANLLNCTIWNYTANNTNARGDLWNDEDLSLFSRDQQDGDNIHSGGRGIAGFARPYAKRTAGEPLRMSFDLDSRVFEFEFRPDPAVTAPTEIFVPDYQYPNGYTVELSGGTWRAEGQTVLVDAAGGGDVVMVRISPV
jgi:hypothetical protein